MSTPSPLDSVIDVQQLGNPLSSADRLAEYLLEEERRHFGEGIGSYKGGELELPHIFAYVVDHRVQYGDATEMDQESYEELKRLHWLPYHPFVVHQSEKPGFVIIAPPTASNTYHSDQYYPSVESPHTLFQ